ncbi:MAG: hypothetical protein QM770_14010 [Tepidisphaeraceae bacterium]
MTALDEPNSQQHAQPPAGEAFGQQGVLANLSALLAKLALVGALIACVAWHRSYSVREGLRLLPAGKAIEVTSVVGRIRVAIWPTDVTSSRSPVPISSDAPDLGPGQDPWEDGIWKTIGFETVEGPVDRGSLGSITRIQWRTIVILLLLPPVWHYWTAYRRKRAAEQTDVDATAS